MEFGRARGPAQPLKPETYLAPGESPGLTEKPRGLNGEIRQNAIGPGSLEGQQAFQDRSLAIEPAVLRRGTDHRILAAHLIGERRHAERLLNPPYDIEIR